MKKKVCYVLMISKHFPAYHPKAGQETNFEFKILQMTKLHTIRSNYELWKKRFEKIDKGEAYISVRQWEGKPRHSKQIELFKFDKSDGVGIQKLFIKKPPFRIMYIYIDDKERKEDKHLSRIARNDGLILPDFMEWFKPYKLDKPLAIIHFTDFRY